MSTTRGRVDGGSQCVEVAANPVHIPSRGLTIRIMHESRPERFDEIARPESVRARPESACTRPESVCAVIVTYHPDDGIAARVEAVARQVGLVVIVDNGSSECEVQILRGLETGNTASLILNPLNFGVGQALNLGVRTAIARGFRWALLLDQDTDVGGDMVQELIAVYESHPRPESLAVIGSGYNEIHPGRRQTAGASAKPAPGESPEQSWEDAEAVITSGSLLPLDAYQQIGPFREEFFVDYIDVDFCYRARSKGFHVIKTRKALMAHQIGLPTLHRVLWMSKRTMNHGPDRRYYIARNGTILLREYGGRTAIGWCMKSLQRGLRLIKRIALFEERKTGKILAVVEGLWDGARGRTGPRRGDADISNAAAARQSERRDGALQRMSHWGQRL